MKTPHQSFLALILLLAMGSCIEPKAEHVIDVTELTIAEIHEGYRQHKFTSEALVQQYLDRINRHDRTLNAITTINPEALAQARALDEEYRETGVLRPFHGIPIIVKDNINTAGLPTTAGALALKDFIPEEDAFIIKKLVAAGAILIAKSNMAEWAFSPMHTESSTAGTTRNPYNPSYVPAGSSGGTAAAIAANFGTIGLGTDTGNSIRGPSSHCALVGFRTTLGLVSRSAIVPLYLRNDVVGPMGRTVADATKLLEVVAGYDPADTLTARSKGKIPENYTQFLLKDGLAGARIGVLADLSYHDIHPEVKTLFLKALTEIKALGAQVVDSVRIPEFETLREDQWCASFKDDIAAYLKEYVKNDTLQTIDDIIRIGSKSRFAEERLLRNAAHTGRWTDSETPCLDAYSDAKRIAFRTAVEQTMDALGLDALIYPSWNHPPAKIDAFSEEYKGDNSQVISPHTGQPAFTVPMGYTGGGLPAGLQFLGRMYDEPTLIRLCYAYEQGTHHRKVPDLSY